MITFFMVIWYYIYIQGHLTMVWLLCSESYLPIATCCSSVNLPYCTVGFHMSHTLCLHQHTSHSLVITAELRSAAGVCWDLEGRLKALSAGRTPLHRCFHMVGSPVPNLTLKLWTTKFSQFLFSHLVASYKIYKKLYHSKLSHYTVHFPLYGTFLQLTALLDESQ